MDKYNEKAINTSRSKRSYIVDIIGVILTAIGTILVFIFGFTSPKKINVNVAEILSLAFALFGIAINMLNYVLKYREQCRIYMSVPVKSFYVTRKSEKNAIIRCIYEKWLEEKASDPIILFSAQSDGTGKSSLLKELEYFFKHKRKMLKNLRSQICKNAPEFLHLKKIKKKLRYVFSLDAAGDYESVILSLPKARKNKLNIVLVDNVINISDIADALKNCDYYGIFATKGKTNISTSTPYCIEVHALSAEEIQNYFRRMIKLDNAEAVAIKNMTGGSPKKIEYNLRNPEIGGHIADIAMRKYKTEFQEKLDDVSEILTHGNYAQAENALNNLGEKYGELLQNNYLLNYDYTILKADVLHLLNNYIPAQKKLDILYCKEYSVYDNDNTVDQRYAHYYKHMGKFDDAIDLMKKCNKKYKLISLNILSILSDLLNYDGHDLDARIIAYKAVPSGAAGEYLADLNEIYKFYSAFPQLTNTAYEYYHRYYDIADWLKQYNNKGYGKIKCINPYLAKNAFYVMQSRADRLEANDRFIIAEMDRVNFIQTNPANLADKLKSLIPEYLYIWYLSIKNHDYNLQSEVEAILFYLEKVYNINNNLNIDIAKVKRKCTEKNMYFNAKICSALLDIVNKSVHCANSAGTITANGAANTATSVTVEEYYKDLFAKIPFIIL